MHNTDIKKYTTFSDFTVGNSKVVAPLDLGSSAFRLMYCQVALTATSAVTTTRLLNLEIRDAQNNLLLTIYAKSNQAMGTLTHYTLFSGAAPTSAGTVPKSSLGINDVIQFTIPEDTVVLPTHTMTIKDINARDVNDTLAISGMVAVLR